MDPTPPPAPGQPPPEPGDTRPDPAPVYARYDPAAFAGGSGLPAPNPYAVAPAPPAPARPRTRLWWGIGGLVVLLVVCCAGTAAFALTQGILGIKSVAGDAGAANAVVVQFMAAGAMDDPQSGYALFAPTATTTQRDVATLFSSHPDYFQGYTGLQQDSFNIFSGTGGTTATIGGRVTYTGRAAMGYTAHLIKTGGQWRLVSVQLAEGVGH